MTVHREPTRLKLIPLTRECLSRRSVWWHILYLDQYFSSTLGRPLSVSCFGDCLPPVPLKVDDTEHRLLSFICQFTVNVTEILRCEDLTCAKIQDFSEKLLRHLDTLPTYLQFSETWLNSDAQVPEWPLDIQAANLYIRTHIYLILMNRQRQSEAGSEPFGDGAESLSPYTITMPNPITSGARSISPESKHANNRQFSNLEFQGDEYYHILSSSRAILHAFEYLCSRDSLESLDWTICQAAFHAAYMLGLAMYERNDFETDIQRVLTARSSFVWLANAADSLGATSPLRSIMDLSSIASERLAIFLRGTWNNFGSQEDTPSERDKVMDRKGMVLLEDPGLICASSKGGGLGVVDWQMVDSKDWGSESSQKPNERSTLLMHDRTSGESALQHDQDTASVLKTAPDQQTSRSSSHFAALHSIDSRTSTSHRMVPTSDTTKMQPFTSLDRYQLISPPADDMDGLLSTAPFSHPLDLHQGISAQTPTLSFPTIPINARVLGTGTGPGQSQPLTSYSKLHPPQVLQSPTERYAYNAYPPHGNDFHAQMQHGQSPSSSAGHGQGANADQGHLNTPSSIVDTPGNSFFAPDIKPVYQQQALPSTDATPYTQAELAVSRMSAVYLQDAYSAVVGNGLNWSQIAPQ